MKQPVRAGKARLPVEWRHALMLPWHRRTAIIAVAGATTREEAADILAGHLPLVPAPAPDPELDTDPDLNMDPEAGPGPGGPGDDVPEHAEDTETARRIARSLGSWRAGPGLRELLAGRAINPVQPAVYAWRKASPGEYVYRLWPDGSCTAAALFGQENIPARSGQMRPRLTARRYA